MKNEVRADDAERSLLGALLINPRQMAAAQGVVSATDFAGVPHRTLFGALEAMYAAREPIDLVTVSAELERTGKMAFVGGAAYLAQLLDRVPDVDNVVAYAKLVRDASLRRALQAQARKIEAAAGSRDAASVVAEAARDIRALGADGSGAAAHIASGIGAFARTAESVLRRGGALMGVPTGFARLDEATSGLQGPDFVIVAGRPGMGKTAFATHIACAAALSGKKVLFFSLEMSSAQLAMRVACDLAGVPLAAVRDGRLSAGERVALAMASAIASRATLWVDDSSRLTVADAHAKADRMKQTKGLDLVVVDYIGLMSGHGRTENRTQEVASFSRGLKALAKDLSVPVVALSQLSREIERREDREPQLSDLRESGSIEQDADIVIFLSRSAYYDRNAEHEHLAEVILAKYRNGAPGRFTVGWRGELTRFADLSRTE